MRAKHIFLYFLTLAFVLSGCAHTLEATLSPDLEIDRASIGQGKTIALKVVDDRADEVVALVGREDKITIREDIGEIIYWEIAEGLEAKTSHAPKMDPLTHSPVLASLKATGWRVSLELTLQ